MSLPIISVEKLSKAYRIGVKEEGATTLAGAAVGALKSPFKNFRRLRRLNTFGEASDEADTHWALRDVSFEVAEGEVVGIIGRNGAGKSTLLKLLSRITEPTSGRAVLRGRVSSLLEVGTGFHPELTGRENVYLNGTILGMTKREVERKFDEIVEFSGIEKFLDTPIKRYSSGMTVRLAFAVAAHLEPEILIIDEVLAVGDAEFQKKCLGKMKDVAAGGRTVLFVSHNTQAVTSLTTTCVYLRGGNVQLHGPTERVLPVYLGLLGDDNQRLPTYVGDESSYIRSISVKTSTGTKEHVCREPIEFTFSIRTPAAKSAYYFTFQVADYEGRPICHFWPADVSVVLPQDKTTHTITCAIPALNVYMGTYTLNAYLSDRSTSSPVEQISNVCPFSVSMHGLSRKDYEWVPNAMVYWEPAEWSRLADS